MDRPPSYFEISIDDPQPDQRALDEDTARRANPFRALWTKFRNHRKVRRYNHVPANEKSQSWQPVTHSIPFLGAVVVISISLITIIQILLSDSQQNDGILFTPDINRLPLRQSFSYLYLPTIVSVLYSLTWNWVDLDAKRLEPYYQLSRPQRVSAVDSVLLDYPFDFLASVPLKAVKRRHWPVFVVSIATVLISWGLTPTQSGIFATDTVTRRFSIDMARSTDYTPWTQRKSEFTALYAQSVYNILWLNETVPSFMTPNYTLAPFGPIHNLSQAEDSESWTAPTTLYSVDVTCTRPRETESDYILDGCSYMKPGHPAQMTKTYSSMYVGYYYGDGTGGGTGDNDYYLSEYCPRNISHSFLAIWSSSSWNTSSTDSVNETALYCAPTYYQQEVNATVSAPDHTVLGVTALGPKLALPASLFNSTAFEIAISAGSTGSNTRGNFPVRVWPDMTAHLQYVDLDLNYLPTMATFAVAAYQRPAATYLDPEVLRTSYEAAYRLLFARQLVDVLSKDLDSSTVSSGERTYRTQSVIAVPVFAYLAEGILALVVIFAAFLFCLNRRRPKQLASDPASIASTMSLVADEHQLLETLKSVERASAKALNNSLEQSSYTLKRDTSDGGCRLELMSMIETSNENVPGTRSDPSTLPLRGIRPAEFRLWTGLVFASFLSAVFVLVAVGYSKARSLNGIPLPSQGRFIRQLVENYIPTAIATIIEPVWVVLTRLFCVLQPFEELRLGRATSSTTISADYTSLPPQLVLFKALRSRHFVLSTVCCMSILANILAVAFSGLFYEDSVPKSHAANFTTPLRPFLNATPLSSTMESRPYRSLANTDQFYIYMSNLTAGTPLPPWTDESLFYLPFNPVSGSNTAWNRKATAVAYGANLTCKALKPQGSDSVNFRMYKDPDEADALKANLTVRLAIDNDGQKSGCEVEESIYMSGSPSGRSAAEVTIPLCEDYFLAGWMRANLTWPATSWLNHTPPEFSWSFLGCRAAMTVGFADIEVDSQGKILTTSPLRAANDTLEVHLAQNSSDVISSIQSLWTTLNAESSFIWHTDSYPSDFYNYLLATKSGSDKYLDPTLPPPSFDETTRPFEALYSELVALTLSANSDTIFPAFSNTAAGLNIVQETRIFVSKPMFIIAESILGLYMVVSILVYVRRPWRFLPRLPTTIASIIGFFAASHAVTDLEGTAAMTKASRNGHLRKLGHQYGYGTYIGTDGKVHAGIEKRPFFATFTKERDLSSTPSRTGSDAHTKGLSRTRWIRLTRWKSKVSGDVREGGWI